MRRVAAGFAPWFAAIFISVAAPAQGQVPALAEVPPNLPSAQREALSGERSGLEGRWTALRSKVEGHNSQCSKVPAKSAAAGECRQKMAVLQSDIAAYVDAVREFNRKIEALVAQQQSAPVASLLSERDELELGRRATADMDARMTFVTDPLVTRYVEGVLDRLVRHSPRPGMAYRVRVCSDCAAGLCWAACSLPGGSIYVSTRLLNLLSNEGELAAVLAHEVGHIAARHVAQSTDDQLRATATAALTGGPVWPVVQRALAMKYSRDHEHEADRLAVEMLYGAGIRPTGLTTTLEKFKRLARPPGVLESMEQMYFSTHPSPQARMDSIAPLFADPRFNRIRLTDPADFHTVQRRLPSP